MRRKLFKMVNAGGDDNFCVIYDSLMMFVIIASLVPLCFKNDLTIFIWIDRITVGVFVIDYFLRWLTADFVLQNLKKRAFVFYPFTVWALIDLLAILPSLSILSPSFRILKVFRLLRTLRVLKFLRYSKSLTIVISVINKEKKPLLAVCYMAIGYIFVTALIMFSVEPNSFDSMFDALYWATTALTTVGYGDIYPITYIGRFVSMISSLVGIAVVALPSGIITAGYMAEIKANAKENV